MWDPYLLRRIQNHIGKNQEVHGRDGIHHAILGTQSSFFPTQIGISKRKCNRQDGGIDGKILRIWDVLLSTPYLVPGGEMISNRFLSFCQKTSTLKSTSVNFTFRMTRFLLLYVVYINTIWVHIKKTLYCLYYWLQKQNDRAVHGAICLRRLATLLSNVCSSRVLYIERTRENMLNSFFVYSTQHL